MALTEPQKSSIRRHLKYGNIGLSINSAGGGSLGANAGWRYFGEWGELEMAMDMLQPVDEASITGAPYGLMVLQGPDPAPGDELVFMISGGGLSAPQTIAVSATGGQSRDDFAASISKTVAQNSAVNSARIVPFAPSNGGASGVQNPLSQIEFVGQSPFSLALVSATGNIGANITENGSAMTDVMQTISSSNIYGFLPICNVLYSLIGTANDRMSIAKADVFTARPTEYKERRHAWKQAVDDMADFLVARVNPNPLNGSRSNIGSL